MKKALFEELVASVKQATEIARGARTPSRTFEVNAATIKQLRSRTKLSQPEFAALLGVELSTLEIGSRGGANLLDLPRRCYARSATIRSTLLERCLELPNPNSVSGKMGTAHQHKIPIVLALPKQDEPRSRL